MHSVEYDRRYASGVRVRMSKARARKARAGDAVHLLRRRAHSASPEKDHSS
jgi:hypothetical protein